MGIIHVTPTTCISSMLLQLLVLVLQIQLDEGWYTEFSKLSDKCYDCSMEKRPKKVI